MEISGNLRKSKRNKHKDGGGGTKSEKVGRKKIFFFVWGGEGGQVSKSLRQLQERVRGKKEFIKTGGE